MHPRVDIPPRKGIARRGAGRLGAEGARVRPGGAMGKGYIARDTVLHRLESLRASSRRAFINTLHKHASRNQHHTAGQQH